MVEWKQMWEVTTWDKKFSGVEKYMQPKVIKYYYYLANDLVNLERPNGDVRILYTTNKEAYAISNEVEGNISEGEVVTIPWGGNVNIQYYKGKFVTADNRIATSNNIDYLSNKFLYYWMLSQKEEIAKMYRGAGIQHPSMLSVLTMSIPIPSLSEQQRIVGILDTFTSAIDNLKEQIAQRRKQYEYYRDQLLDLEGKPEVEMKTLGDIMQIVRGASPRPIKNFITTREDGVNWIKIGDVAPGAKYITCCNEKITKDGAEKSRFLHVGDFILSNSMSFGRPYILKIDGCIHDGWIAMSDFEKYVLPDFLYEYLNSDVVQRYWIMKANNGGAMTNLNSDIVKETPIRIPSFLEQQRIVSILDTFEASIQNLEAQLKQREKQYEYYRNQLLTFE